MNQKWIFRDIDELVTPVGVFRVMDGNRKVQFSVIKNGLDWPSEVRDENGNIVGTIRTDTNYRIVIPTGALDIGKDYVFSFSAGKWEYCDSDEHTTCCDAVIGDWVVGIGAYDPNDQEKEDQMWNYSREKGYLDHGFAQEPETYDETNFIQYTVETLEELNGYRFKLYDYNVEAVYFEVAWIKIGEYPTVEYEGALGLWLC